MKTLTLSGWTQPADALSRIVPDSVHFDYSDYASPEESFEGLKPFADIERVVAWSLGGQLALRAIAAGVLKPKKLVLIAAPFQFVSEFGMDDFTFNQFRTNYANDAARSKTRFHGLIAKGDKHHRDVVTLLGHHPEVENTARWLPWLDDLSRFSVENLNVSAIPEPLIIHGENDVIVPVEQSEMLVKHLGCGILEKWKECGHAPHLHDTDTFRARISECL
ncbi:MAG: alpha/beta hydrolase [Alphaproteobacteria bacterium]|nr:alpha/beta hydrolase [Alphaproteobacteria bacterium]